MKYIIYKAIILFSNSSKTTFHWTDDNVTEENSCNDIEEYRKNLKERLNKSLNIINLEVENIRLVYAERDGRQ